MEHLPDRKYLRNDFGHRRLSESRKLFEEGFWKDFLN